MKVSNKTKLHCYFLVYISTFRTKILGSYKLSIQVLFSVALRNILPSLFHLKGWQ